VDQKLQVHALPAVPRFVGRLLLIEEPGEELSHHAAGHFLVDQREKGRDTRMPGQFMEHLGIFPQRIPKFEKIVPVQIQKGPILE